jgi:REP element-mobilizing transposase RayT
MKDLPRKPRRLDRIFQNYAAPVYFITFNTYRRRYILATEEVHHRFIAFSEQAITHGAAIGRYVIMPDHIHLFMRIVSDRPIGITVRLLKRSLSAAIETNPPHWQPGFFDHLLRHGESYAEKWEYVRQNPVRAGLVHEPEKWPHQGQIVPIIY